jgi:hypothetical protein
MRTLGLDPSLSAYGWAIHDSDATGMQRRVASGHEGTLPSAVPVARFMHYRALVERLLLEYQPDVVGIESPAYDAGPFQTIHFGLMMFSMESIFKRRKDLVLFDPATLKGLARFGLKNKIGMISKQDMQRFVQLDTLDTNIIDNNEADAYCVAYFSARFMGVINGSINPEDLTQSELNTFLLRKKNVKTVRGKKIKMVSHAFRENSRYFRFSAVPEGEVNLPNKASVNPDLIEYLEALEPNIKL